MPFVRIMSGPERDTFVAVTRTITTIGRGLNCAVQLFDDAVSRLHCRIVFEDNAYWVEEAGPTNPVILNAKRVGRARLTFGSKVLLGETELEFVKDKPGPPRSKREDL
jgi:pSer/pThr/pTyr-binding forkhead associated (FHA) protein